MEQMIKFIFLLLISTQCLADSPYFLKVGAGLDNNIGASKILSVGRQAPLFSIFDYQLEAGGFNDNNQSNGMIGFTAASLGVTVKSESGIYTKLFSGPSLITQTDSRLSSIFEFNNDLELGLKDKRGVGLGIDLKHMSNAGIVGPNLGRNFLTIKVEFPF